MTITMTALVPTFTLADRLRKARELTGLDQGEFAERAEISRNTVANYEHGYRTPRRIYLKAWAEAAGVDLQWLETGVASPAATAADEANVCARRDSNPQPSVLERGATALTVMMLAGLWATRKPAIEATEAARS